MVTCATVRDLLPEHALGVAASLEAAAVDRHLAWCAACRKESRDLGRAAATFAFALPPADPEPGLEDQVRRRVGDLARPTRRPHHGRRMGTVLLAAALVSASLLGVAIADREPARDQVPATNDRTSMSLEDFSDLIRQAEFDDSEAFLGTLAPTAKGGRAGGSALTIASPSVDDQVIVIAAGLSPRERRLPYRVTLRDAQGHRMRVGMIRSVDAGGGATVGRIVRGSLIGFMYVVVRDANGVIVLEGTLGAPTALLSPSPTVLRGVPRQP